MNKRLLSGVMAGVMAVTSSAVLEIQSFAEESSVTLKTATLGSWESCGDVLLASAGILTEDSIIRVTSTAGTNLKEENDDGETVTPEYAFGIVCDNEWNKESENYIRATYNSETGVSTCDVPYSKLNNLSRINVQSNLHSESTIKIEAIGFAEDTRAASTLADVTTPIELRVSSDSSWLIGKMADGRTADAALTSAWKGKTVGELRAAVKELKVGSVGYASDTAGAGSDVFGRGVYVDCGDGGFFQGEGTALDAECLALTDDMFQKNANDSCVIQEIGTYVGSLFGWDGDAGKSVSLSEKIDALADGSTIIYEPVQDSRAVLNLAAPSGRITMYSYVDDSEGSWINGGWAWGSYYYNNIEGVTYGTTTFGQFLEKYKYAKIADIPFYGSSLSSLKADELGYQIAIDFTDDTDINFNGKESLDGGFYFFNADDVDLSTLSNKVVKNIQIKLNPLTYWVNSLNQAKSVNAEIAALKADESFTLDFTKPSGTVLVEGKRKSWESWGGIKIASAGILNEKSTIVISAKLPAGYTETDDETGEIKAPKDIFGIFRDNDWGESYINVAFNSETGESSYTLTYDQLAGKQEIGIQNRTKGEIEFKIEAFGFDEDTRSEVSASKITSLIGIGIEEQQSWIVGNHGGDFIKDEALSSAWSGKTVKELRETVGKINIPAMDYFSDSVNAGSDAFTKGIIIRLNDVDWETGGSRTTFTSSGVDYIDSLFTDDTHDDCTISEIGMWVETAYEWTDLGNTCTSDAINALKTGDTIVIEPVEDNRAAISVPAASGSITMYAFTDSDWLIGTTAGEDIQLDAPTGVTYGKTTIGEFEKNVKTVTFGGIPFFKSSLSGVTADDLTYEFYIDIKDVDPSIMYSFPNLSAKTIIINSSIDALFDEMGIDSNAIISGMHLRVSCNTEYDEESGKHYTTCDAIRNLKDGDTFVIEFTEDTRKAIALPAASGTVGLGAFTDSNWLEGACAFGDLEIYEEPEGVTYGKTTLKEFKEGYKSFDVKEVPFYTSDLEGVTASDFVQEVLLVITDADGENENRISYGMSSLAAGTVLVDDIINNSGITDLENYVVAGITTRITTKLGYNNDTQKSYAVNEAVKALNDGDVIVVELTKDSRKTLTLPALSGALEAGIYYTGETKNAGGSVPIGAISGITYDKSTLKDFKDTYKVINVPAVPFYNSSINSLTADQLLYYIAFNVKDADEQEYTVWYNENDSLDASKIVVDSLLANADGIGKLEDYIVTGIDVFISVKNDWNEGGISNSEINALGEEDTFTINFTEPKSYAPENIKATADDGKVTLTWDAVDGAKGYLIKSADGKTQYTKTIKTTSYTVTGLTNGTTYSFKVYAYDGTKWYASEAISAAPKNCIPKNVKAEALNRSVKLTWDKVDGATGYIVKSADGKTQYTKNAITANTLTVDGLKNGTQYQFKIYACVDGKWRASSRISKTPVAKPAVTATSASHQVTLTWAKVPNATAYIVKSADGTVQYTKKSIKTNSYTITGLKNGTAYKFKVYAYSDGHWFASSTCTKTPTGSPQNVTATAGSKKVTLTWDKVDGATGYIVKSADGKTTYTKKSIKQTSYTVTGLTAGKQYKFKVYAYVDGKWYASGTKTKTPKA